MAFTLSETLIALVVIGIIAAITVPNIVAHQREVATVEKVKKFYSTMSNAVKRAIVDTGLNVDEWNFRNSVNRQSSVEFMEYLKPYLILSVDDCGNDSNGACYTTDTTKTLSGDNWYQYYAQSNSYKAILNDGSVFWLRTNGKPCKNDGEHTEVVCAFLMYDINGTKNPNTLGKDIFQFIIVPDGVLPRNTNECSLSNIGTGCAKYILKNNNMDYLH